MSSYTLHVLLSGWRRYFGLAHRILGLLPRSAAGMFMGMLMAVPVAVPGRICHCLRYPRSVSDRMSWVGV
jgi:hypothetical protein